MRAKLITMSTRIAKVKKSTCRARKVAIHPWRMCVTAVPENKRKAKEAMTTFRAGKEKMTFWTAQKKYTCPLLRDKSKIGSRQEGARNLLGEDRIMMGYMNRAI
jgi:hypothetical protein